MFEIVKYTVMIFNSKGRSTFQLKSMNEIFNKKILILNFLTKLSKILNKNLFINLSSSPPDL